MTPTRIFLSSVKKNFFNCVNLQKEMCRGYAGHNKWANIKHTKAAKDAEKSILYKRLSQQMRVAIAEGGSKPETNLKLARAVDEAKKLNMPLNSIQQILNTAVKNSSTPHIQYLMEIKGPGGSMLLVEILTSNLSRTKLEISPLLKKSQASVSEGVKYLFDKKGVIQATSLKSYPLDKVIENAIEGGADDVSEIEGENGNSLFQFYSEPDVLEFLKNYLESRDFSVHFASIDYIPLNVIELNEESFKLALKLLQNLSNHPDVMGVYDNFS